MAMLVTFSHKMVRPSLTPPSFLLGLCYLFNVLAVLASSWRYLGLFWRVCGLIFEVFRKVFGSILEFFQDSFGSILKFSNNFSGSILEGSGRFWMG